MSTTARDLINSAFRILGVLAEGETPSNAQANDALISLNDMIDSWSNENLMIVNSVRETFALIASKQTYTMGSGGDFNTTRPMEIQDALVQITNTTPNVELGIDIINQDQYDAIVVKQTTSSIPKKLFYDNAYPLGTLWIFPVPSTANNIVLISKKPLTGFATLDTTASLAPGFNRLIKYNLAGELAPEYNLSLSPEAAAIAMRSMSAVKRRNRKTHLLGQDPAILSKKAFDWRSGGIS